MIDTFEVWRIVESLGNDYIPRLSDCKMKNDHVGNSILVKIKVKIELYRFLFIFFFLKF